MCLNAFFFKQLIKNQQNIKKYRQQKGKIKFYNTELKMQKQLSKKSHKVTESSIDDFMKHIRKYNLQSERHISPKPLLYMYTNPSRHHTLQTLQKSRSKSKTLSNRQYSNSKKALSKNLRQKVQKILSISKKENIHKKSISSISNKKDKSNKKLNKSSVQNEAVKSKNKFTKQNKLLSDFNLKIKSTTMGGSSKKAKKTKSKLDQDYRPKYTQRSPIIEGELSESLIANQVANSSQGQLQNPAELIEIYSKKLIKVQLLLQSNKNKLGSLLCKKFQQILNQIIESLVQNLKKSLNQLELDIQNRLSRKFQSQFDKCMKQKQLQIRGMEKICQKITKKFSDLLHKQNYAGSLIYSLRLKGIDIDNQFGRAVWGVDSLGGCGYNKQQSVQQDEKQQSEISKQQETKRQFKIPNEQQKQQKNKTLKTQNDQSSQNQFQFCQHPKKRFKQQENIPKFNSDQREDKNRESKLKRNKYIQQQEDLSFKNRESQNNKSKIKQCSENNNMKKII